MSSFARSAHMETVKTLDRNYLATHPAGEERAELTLSHPVPGRIDVPENPDGTRPKVSLSVTGDTYRQVLATLTALHEDGGEELLGLLLEDVVTDEELDRFESMDDAAPLLRERVQQVVVPFRTFKAAAQLPAGIVQIAITAPSLQVAVEASVGMTSPRTLTNLAIGLCPTVEDEDDWAENEVLVVS